RYIKAEARDIGPRLKRLKKALGMRDPGTSIPDANICLIALVDNRNVQQSTASTFHHPATVLNQVQQDLEQPMVFGANERNCAWNLPFYGYSQFAAQRFNNDP